MNLKRGFTLIELLAVIIILAIVALIATPIILDVIDDARKSAGLSEANMILGGINNYCATEEIKVQMNSSYTAICKSGITEEDVKKMVNLGNADIIEIEYTNKLTWLKVESNGIIFSLQDNVMVEGDFEKPVPSFANDSWSTIVENIKNGNASAYNVGDTKEVTLTGTYAGTYTVRIANNSTPTECSTEGFSQTACGFVVEFVDIITAHNMNSTSTNKGGWPASEMYSFVNTDIYNALPSDLQNVIIDTYTVSSHGSGDSSNFTSTDKLYLLSTKEVWGKEGSSNIINTDSAEAETRQLDYYKNNGVTTDSYSGAVKTYKGSASVWWLRSPYSDTSDGFHYVGTSGERYVNSATSTIGVAPAFRIG